MADAIFPPQSKPVMSALDGQVKTDAVNTGRRRPKGSRRHTKRTLREQVILVAISTGSMVGFLSLWQLAYALGWIDLLFFSAPSKIATTTIDLARSGQLSEAVIATLKLFVVGFGISALLAVPLGVVLGWYPRLYAAFDPFVSGMYAAPRIALIPLVLVWFGIGFQAETFIVALGAFFPILVNTIAGVRAIDPDLLQVARSYGASDRDIFRTLALPSALPFIISGFRHGQAQALNGVIVAEFFVGQVGIGKLITDAGLTFRTDVVFAGILVVALAALVLNAALGAVEKHFARWRPEQHQ